MSLNALVGSGTPPQASQPLAQGNPAIGNITGETSNSATTPRLYLFCFSLNVNYLESKPADRRLLDIFGHLIADAFPWLCLLQQEPVPETFNGSPHWPVEECRSNLAIGQEKLEKILSHLTEENLEEAVLSPGPHGRMFSNTVAEILTHFLSHGQHHRGQIEWIIEQETGEYLPTSYMPYVRQHKQAVSTLGTANAILESAG